MATYAPERLDTRQRSSSDARASPHPDPDWSPLLQDSNFEPAYTTRQRTPLRRESDRSRRPFYANGTYRTFEDHERWDAQYRQANALQPRAHAYRARSADYRRQDYSGGRVLTPEPPGRFEHKANSDPQTPRFEELADDLKTLRPSDGVISNEHSDCDEYEAPSTLLGQARDCMDALARAARKARALDARDADLSVSVVGHRCEDILFRLKVWIAETKLENMPAAGDDELDNEAINLTSSILYRLHARADSLARHVDRAGRSARTSFSFAEPPQQAIDGDASDDERTEYGLPSEDLAPAGRIEQDLKQVELQIRTLRRLTRSLRIVSGDDFSAAVMRHVAEVTKLFGTKEECDKWREEAKGMPADAALREIREKVGDRE